MRLALAAYRRKDTLKFYNPILEAYMVTVRAVDIGYGNSKYIASRLPGRDICCNLFPSVVAHASSQDLSGGVIARRNTVCVEVSGNHYEVGPDVELALNVHSSRVLHKDFTHTPEYLALLRGALSYMQVPHIDLLVVGLPVSMLASKSSWLKETLQGTHTLGKGEAVTVNKVMVIAQPLGGFIDHALTEGLYGRLRETRNLVVDPGFFTIDWVLARGIQPIAPRCGSFPGGVHTVLRRLAQSLGEEYAVDLDDLGVLDRALRNGVLTLYGKDIAIEKYITSMRPVVDEAIHAMASSVGDGRDIDTIVLVGGGAQLYRAAIEHRFPSHQVQIVADPIFANVRGFQLAGEEVARRNKDDVA
jgi:plasmid segregation protein ParM